MVVGRTSSFLSLGRVLVCHTIPPEKVHADMFKGANKKFKRLPWRLIAKQRQNAERTEEQNKKKKRKLLAKEEKKRQKLKALGIDYDFAGYSNKTTNYPEETSDNEIEKLKTTAKRGRKTTTKANSELKLDFSGRLQGGLERFCSCFGRPKREGINRVFLSFEQKY